MSPKRLAGRALAGVVIIAAILPLGSAAAQADRGSMIAPHGMYWGAWIDKHRSGASQPPWDMAPVAQLEQQVGKQMSLVEFGTPMLNVPGDNYYAFPVREFETLRAHGSIPFFSWSTHRMRTYADPNFTLRAIIRGRQDAYLRAWADAARAWGHPFFLRFDWEMNGGWFPWGERYGSNRRGEYVRAWRHVHEIFAAAGATNATWVWCPSADPRAELQNVKQLYPGDDYVDWTCMDVYNYNSPWTSFARQAGRTYTAIRRIAPTKPMVIGEVASTDAGGSKAGWIRDMFAGLKRRFRAIHGLIWYDAQDGGSSKYRDWPLDSSSAVTKAFARGIAARRFHANTFGGGAAEAPTARRRLARGR
jgi:hypothetical protein